MDLKKKISNLRLIASLLFITAVISLLGSLWLNNYIIGFNFSKGYNFENKLTSTPGDYFQEYINCEKNESLCKEILAIYTEKSYGTGLFKIKTQDSDKLGDCFIYEVDTIYQIDGKTYSLNEIFPSTDEGERNIKKEFKNKNILLKSTVSNNKVERCIKNHFSYNFYKIFPLWHETIWNMKNLRDIALGSSEKINPFIYGEASISNIVKRFPINIVFKSFLYISVVLMFAYWLYYNLLFKKIVGSEKNLFLFFGIGSAVFLFFHILFLGMSIESEIFHKIRRLIIILFIFFELMAQILLTKNLYNNIDTLIQFCNIAIIKIKVIFIFIVILVSSAVILILMIYDMPSKFDYILEWNYFFGLLIFYFLSAIMWKKQN